MMMKTSRVMPEYYYKPNEKNNRSRDHSYVSPRNTTYITNRSQQEQYNKTERDFDDRKRSYFVPPEYENDDDMSQIDERPVYDEKQDYYSPKLVRRRRYREYDDDYNEELPVISSRRRIHALREQPQVIKRTYFRPSPTPSPPPPERVEYVYEDDYRPKNEEIIEYVVPKQRYIEEPQPVRRPRYVEKLPSISRSPYERSPRASPAPIKSHRLNEFASPRYLKIKQQQQQQQQNPRTTIIHESSNRSFSQVNNKSKQLNLKQIVAQNRARRGSRMPMIRREVYEEKFHDLPTYNKNYVKNDFIVHK